MGLIECPDCEGKVSDSAPACPHCGRPFGKSPATKTAERLEEKISGVKSKYVGDVKKAFQAGLEGKTTGFEASCPSCSKEVSTKADVCPHCAHPLKRGFFGASFGERALNLGCLFILIIWLLYWAWTCSA